MAKHIYFVRHGESTENTERILLGADAPLTETGRLQAERIAERAAEMGAEAILTSPFLRARDTAAAIAKRTGLPLEESDLFIERREPSALYGKHESDPETQEIVAAMHALAEAHEHHSDEESLAELTERAKQALTFLEAHPAERLFVVTHSLFLRALVHAAVFNGELSKQLFFTMRQHLHTDNTGVSHMRFDPEKRGWKLATWNDTTHLG